MAWIADHILWLLLGGWVLSLLVGGRALLAIWRWIRPKPGPSSRSRFKLAGAALVDLAIGGRLSPGGDRNRKGGADRQTQHRNSHDHLSHQNENGASNS